MLNKKLIVTFIMFSFAISTAFAGPFKANANTKRIPAGTVLEIKMLENRQKSTVGVYIPNREDHLFSLLYHALLQKPSLSDKYYIAKC